jgi:hypothetical protein
MQFNWKKIDYTSPAGAQGGPGVGRAFSWYFGTPYLDMSAAQLANLASGAGLTIGDTWWLGGGQAASGGNCFQVVKAIAALTEGQLVAMADPAASTVVAGPTTSVIGWTAGGLTVNAEKDNWLWITATGATTPQLRRIKSNTATTLTVAEFDQLRPNLPRDADVFDTLATAGDVAVIIRPHQVKVCTATDVPIGVALGAVTINQFTIIQKAGLAAVGVDADGGGATPIVVGKQAVSTAAGWAVGVAAPTIYSIGASMIPLVASTAAAGTLLPFYVNFTGV